MIRRPAAQALLVGCALWLAACAPMAVKPDVAAVPVAAEQAAWDARRTALQKLTVFSLQGRLAESGIISFGGSLSWRQDGENLEVRFYGPLGVGAVNLRGTLGALQVQTKDGSYLTNSPEDLMQQKLGWSLPVEGLRWWVLGLPSPETEAKSLQLDAAGRVQSMEQDGWQLEYTDYQPVNGLDLPHKFSLNNPARGFHLVIDLWSDVR